MDTNYSSIKFAMEPSVIKLFPGFEQFDVNMLLNGNYSIRFESIQKTKNTKEIS